MSDFHRLMSKFLADMEIEDVIVCGSYADVEEYVVGLEAERDQLRQQIERAIRERNEAEETVSRVWSALGITSYEEAKGMSIWDLVAELRQQNAASKQKVGNLTRYILRQSNLGDGLPPDANEEGDK